MPDRQASKRRLTLGGILRVLLPVLVLTGSLGVAWRLVATKPALTPEPIQERVWVVETETIALGTRRPDLHLFGEVVAGHQAELRALVAGQVARVGDGLMEGGTVRQGALLLEIEPFDYAAAVNSAAAQLSEAHAKLAEIEARVRFESEALKGDREILALRQREVERKSSLAKRGNVAEQALEDSRRDLLQQQLAITNRQNNLAVERTRLDQQKAVLQLQEVKVATARRDLERTKLTAPFDGVVVDPRAERGMRLSVNDHVATIVDTTRLEVRAQMANADFGRLQASAEGVVGRAVTVFWRIGSNSLRFPAVIVRGAGRIDAASGSVEVFARIDGIGLDTPLRPGAFVEVLVPDRAYAEVAELPARALHGDDTVYAVVDGRLQARKVTVAARIGDRVLVQGELRDGDAIATTRLTEIGPGLAVQVR